MNYYPDLERKEMLYQEGILYEGEDETNEDI